MHLILPLYFGTGERKVDRCKGEKRTIYLRRYTSSFYTVKRRNDREKERLYVYAGERKVNR